MNYQKLTKKEKERQREIYKEFQIILTRHRAIGFQYVCFRPPQEKNCFGSIMPRKILPDVSKINPNLGPGHYETTYHRNQDHPVIKHKISKYGHGGLAAKANRFKDVECDTKFTDLYAPSDAQAKTHAKPFGFGARRFLKRGKIHTTTPAPGTYFPQFKRKDNKEYNFGGKINVRNAVDMICSIKNESVCDDCKLKPILDDYWKNWRNDESLCNKCMQKKWREMKNSTGVVEKYRMSVELEKFVQVRHCAFYHDHRNTKAAIQLLTKNQLKNKFRRENYLSTYM